MLDMIDMITSGLNNLQSDSRDRCPVNKAGVWTSKLGQVVCLTLQKQWKGAWLLF